MIRTSQLVSELNHAMHEPRTHNRLFEPSYEVLCPPTGSATKSELIARKVRDTYHKLKRWDFSRTVAILVTHDGIEEALAKAMKDEYIRYIALVVNHLDEVLPISAQIDPFWHGHIINTNDYVAMCEHLGVDYIHHNPTVSPLERQSLQSAFDTTLVAYEAAFNKPSARWWPANSMVCGNNGERET
jgi:hypothetical protein